MASAPKTVEPNSFLVLATGTIESAIFPLGPESSQVFCRFEVITGSDWEHLSGVNHGISQAAMPKQPNDKIVFNIPFECIYRSDSPFGWPQVLVSVYGRNRWSVETILGYCWGHFPIIGSEKVQTTQPIRVPRKQKVMGALSSWIKSNNPELKDPKVLLDSYENTNNLSVEKKGELTLTLRTLCRGTNNDFCEPEPYEKPFRKATNNF